MPECAEGCGDEAVAELGGVGAGVEDGSGEEAKPDAVPHPGEVGGVGWADGGRGFAFDCSEATSAEVDEQVDLVSSVPLADVEDPKNSHPRLRGIPEPQGPPHPDLP